MVTTPTPIKDSQSYHFSASAPRKDRSLLWATVIAVAVHAGVIFGIGFASEFDPTPKVQDVATALTQTTEPNEDAHFIANASQQGSGQVRQQLRMESTDISPLSADEMLPTEDIINQQRQERQQRYQQSYLRTTLSYRQVDNEGDNKNKDEADALEEQEERLRREIATLEAQLSQRQQFFAKQTKVETVDSNSTTHGEASEYLERFRQHVESVGNASYPKQAWLQGIQGEVILMVVITPDGNIKAIRLLESSGSTILDEAAKQSVRLAAPFGKFSADMKDIVELRIIRTWHYGDGVTVTH